MVRDSYRPRKTFLFFLAVLTNHWMSSLPLAKSLGVSWILTPGSCIAARSAVNSPKINKVLPPGNPKVPFSSLWAALMIRNRNCIIVSTNLSCSYLYRSYFESSLRSSSGDYAELQTRWKNYFDVNDFPYESALRVLEVYHRIHGDLVIPRGFVVPASNGENK